MLEAKEANIITSDLYFTPSNVTDKSVTMTAATGEGKTLTLTYTLGNDYMLHMSLQANGMAGLFSPN
jgi:YidC/Oxa1 family membrane protein insertase